MHFYSETFRINLNPSSVKKIIKTRPTSYIGILVNKKRISSPTQKRR